MYVGKVCCVKELNQDYNVFTLNSNNNNNNNNNKTITIVISRTTTMIISRKIITCISDLKKVMNIEKVDDLNKNLLSE